MKRTFVHNSTVVAATLATIVLAGFGCGSQKTPPSAAAPAATSDGGPVLPTEWATYRNEAWGIAIPYPEGWYVEEEPAATSFYPVQPPPNSDMPPNLWFDRHDLSIAEFVLQLDNIESDSTEERSGRRMRRIVRRDDLSDDRELAISYLWEDGVTTYRIGGRQGDSILEWVVDHLEVLP